MADGDVRGAETWSKPDGHLPRRRGAARSMKSIPELPPGADTQIADHNSIEARLKDVRDGGGGTRPSVNAASALSPAAIDAARPNADGDGRGAVNRSDTGAVMPRRRGTDERVLPTMRMSPGADTEIGRQKAAERTDAPMCRKASAALADQTIDAARDGDVRDGGGGTDSTMQSKAALSPAANHATVPDADQLAADARVLGVRDGGGGTDSTMQPEEGLSAAAASPHAETIAAIVQLQRQRTFCIRTQSRTDRSTEQFIARECLGYSAALPPDQRKAVMAEAMRIRVVGERPLKQTAKGDRSRGEARFVTLPTNGRDRENPAGLKMVVPSVDPPDTDEQDAGGGRSVAEAQPLLVPTDDRRDHNRPETRQSAVPPVAAPIIQMSYLARTAADSLRKTTEREMARLAATLPVEPWRAEVNGFGRLGLAIIVAEASRDLACYPTVAKLWKRLGLAVIDGERQRRKTDPELAALHGYVPRRRAEMWTLADSMFRHQWHGGQDGNDGAPAGPYGDVYARRRVTTALTHPEWTRAHQRDDAKRVMFKALLADLWGAWCGRRASPPTTRGGKHA